MKTNVTDHIRALDPSHDMPTVLNLIEMGFSEELDPKGWKMLRQMRRMYQPGCLAQAIYPPDSGTRGFVWVEDGRVVGNLSLRHAQPRSNQGQLIGNVVVHPDYRHRGIGRALMEQAIGTARSNNAAWVGLEVRTDNDVAVSLYEHLGFKRVGIVQHLLRPEGLQWPDYPRPRSGWRRSRSEDTVHWTHLARLVYTYEQHLVLEIRPSLYDYGGLEKKLEHILSGQREKAWVRTDRADNVLLAVSVQTDRRYQFHVWDMLLHPEANAGAIQEMIAQLVHTMRRFPLWPVVTLIPDQAPLLEALQLLGFKIHRTLQQMILYL